MRNFTHYVRIQNKAKEAVELHVRNSVNSNHNAIIQLYYKKVVFYENF